MPISHRRACGVLGVEGAVCRLPDSSISTTDTPTKRGIR